MQILLASTSPYRKRLLERLRVGFRAVAPGIDETPEPGEGPRDLAARLALAKARAVAANHPAALVIGSDQVAACGAVLLPKPGGHDAAVRQLGECSGRAVDFYTGLALVRIRPAVERVHVEPFRACFRALRRDEIEQYLRREQPYDCAGSFKVEGQGIALFERLQGEDPTSLEGLPLIALSRLLRELGINPLLVDE
ncbi:MAG: Maf family nucleotide pyrophosphatase [Halioglobus sp.]|nr:Maf family nucleotide pyrophosphatase [Halioglobus sp.]